MLLLLLSLIILIAQGLLGMADWWVLCSNWIVAGLICMGLTAVLNNQRLMVFSHISVSLKAWVLLAGLMNLSAIYVAPSVTLGQLYLSAIGYAGLFMTSFFCWQSKLMPVRSLSLGALVGLVTLLYAPSLLWIIFPCLALFHLSSWSKDNLACVLTGFVTMVWINFCLLNLFGSGTSANGYIFSFATCWSELTYGLPTLIGEGYTRWIFLLSVIGLMIYYILLGLLSSNLNSLRMRSNVDFQVVMGILMVVALPSCWSLYLVLTAITICIHLLLSLGNEPSHAMIKFANVALGFVFFLGLGEYLIRLVIDYISTLSFSLPFDLPFFN